MSLPKPLAEIKADLKELLAASEIALSITTLQGMLPSSAEKKNQAILLEGRLSQINRDHGAGIVSHGDYDLVSANIRKGMLDLVNSLEEKDFEPAPAGASALPPVAAVPKFVIIYDIADSKPSEMLNKHLNVLKITKKIRVYDVHKSIEHGEVVARAKEEIADADYLLVLVTVNLFNSPDWFELVYNAMGEKRRIIPIQMEKADFEGTGLEKLKSLPSMNRAVSQFGNPDAAYVDIVTELRKLLPKQG